MLSHLSGRPLVEVRRGGHVESVHAVAACACDAAGNIRLSIGNIETPVFVRSAVKPLISATIAAAAMQAGNPLGFEELAIIAASHFGEPRHIAVVDRLLELADASEEDLFCGAAWPRRREDIEVARPTYNNCSGKHAGLLYLCKLHGYDRRDYLDPAHPVNLAWMQTASRIYGEDVFSAPQGIDGCGLPVFALSLHAQARAYARIATLQGIEATDRDAVDAVRQAMQSHPQLVGGDGHLDTVLMNAAPGGILAKIGAEGLHCSAVAGCDVGLAVKVIDGHERSRPTAVVGLLRRLGLLSSSAQGELEDLAAPRIRNIAGVLVGDMRFSEESLVE